MRELLGHGKELGFYPKYDGNSLNGITKESIWLMEKEYKWKDQYRGEIMMACTKVMVVERE